MILVMLVSLSRVVLQTLGFEDFGVYNVVGSVVVFLTFLQSALRNATSRYLTYDLGLDNPELTCKTYSMSINAHILLSLILLVLMEIGGTWFLNNKLVIPEDRITAANWVFQFSLLTFCLSIIRTPYESSVLAHEKMNFFALISVVEVVLKLILVYLLICIPFDKLITYSVLHFVVCAILFAWYIIYCKRAFSDCYYQKYWDNQILIKFASYSGWSLLVNSAVVTRSQCINIFFNMFLGVIANAAMGIASQVISAMNMFVDNFTQAFKPQIIKSWASGQTQYFMNLVSSTSKICYYLQLIISIPILLYTPFILNIWLGDYPLDAQVYVQTIILYYLIDAFQSPLVLSVHATGRLKYHQIMIATIMFLVIPVVYLMLKWGCSGKAVLLVNAISNLVCAVARTVYMKRLIDLDLRKYLKEVVFPIIKVSICSLSLALLFKWLFNDSLLGIVISAFSSLVITIGICFFVGLDRREKEIVYSFPVIKTIINKARKNE